MKAVHIRPPLARFQAIWEQLAASTPCNASMIARMLEVSPKSVYRDIEFMRDRLGFPIEWDAVKNRFKLTGKVTCPFCRFVRGAHR